MERATGSRPSKSSLAEETKSSSLSTTNKLCSAIVIVRPLSVSEDVVQQISAEQVESCHTGCLDFDEVFGHQRQPEGSILGGICDPLCLLRCHLEREGGVVAELFLDRLSLGSRVAGGLGI